MTATPCTLNWHELGLDDTLAAVVPELIQGEANPERIAAEAERVLLEDDERAEMRKGLAELRGRLGEGGASGRAAKEVAAVLSGVEERPA